ncbi:hypothetical protein [Blastococcus sp. LR1]|uniref:hypothetical protein n=1 Tax=Blastococcus sp. LR1 TaxID=2877000 RepID=UPI001CCF621B|nr:hypothetical protein [Blastococcus sp. LR1]MCA0146375.1 hypothetical protein [Blastococcus sp. LR1]
MSTRTRRVVLPLSEWRELGARGRRGVRRAARGGQAHPDPYVARLAHAWATEVLRVETARSSRREQVTEVGLGAALLGVVGALLGPAVTGASLGGGLSRRDRRLARRLRALSASR